MRTLTTMWLNDFDTSRLGLIVESLDGWLDSPSTRDRVSQLPTRTGAIILAPDAETAPRTLAIGGLIRRNTMALVRSSIDELKSRLFAGTIEVRFRGHPDRVAYARCEEHRFIPGAPQFAEAITAKAWGRVTFSLFCPDPLVYEREATIVGFTATRRQVPLGTAVSAPTIRIMGPATNPSVRMRDARGVVKTEMQFGATSLLSTDYLEVDCERFTVKRFTSGVESNAISALTSAGAFIALDPQDGDGGSVYPTLEVTSGTGEAHYRRSWI